MKEHIFLKYLNNICNHLNLSQSEIFTKNKASHIVEARRMLWKLCESRGMTPEEIRRYTQYKSNHNVHRSTIVRGIEILNSLGRLLSFTQSVVMMFTQSFLKMSINFFLITDGQRQSIWSHLISTKKVLISITRM